MKLQIVLSVCLYLQLSTCLTVFEDNSVGRGAQARLTKRGLNYAAGIGVRKLQQELRNKHIPNQGGRTGDVSFRAENILIHHLNVGGYTVTPLPNFGLKLAVNNVQLSAQGRVSFKYQKGWIKVGDTTNVKIGASGVSFSLDVKIEARNGKPALNAPNCAAHIGGLNLHFSGGLGWVYNLFSSLLENKLKGVLKNIVCDEGKKLTNKEMNNFLAKFPVQQNINSWALINYAFESSSITSSYLDLMLRGEFLDVKNPVKNPAARPQFDTGTDSSKMAYVWITDYTLNSAGRVFHQAGLLKNVISPLTTKLIPKEVKPFLNTRTFEDIIPQLTQQYPDLPIAFALETFKAPTFDINTGAVNANIYVRATVNVLFTNGTSVKLFYIDLSVKGNGSVTLAKSNGQLIIKGNVGAFSFEAQVGGSIIGDIQAIDNKSIKDLVRGLVIDQANPILNKGFPIPKIKDLDFIQPSVIYTKEKGTSQDVDVKNQDAIRVDTDISYVG